MTAETTSSIRKDLVGMSEEAVWDLIIKKIDQLTEGVADVQSRIAALEWEGTTK